MSLARDQVSSSITCYIVTRTVGGKSYFHSITRDALEMLFYELLKQLHAFLTLEALEKRRNFPCLSSTPN